MPGSEFRVIPRLPLEFETYKLIPPTKLGGAMTAGWSPVAAINYDHIVEGTGLCHTTRFLIGKGHKAGQTGAGPTPMLMFPQPDVPDETPSTEGVQQLLDRLALMSEEEILTLHAELQEKMPPPMEAKGVETEDEAVRDAMDELLADDEDDGTDDDDE